MAPPSEHATRLAERLDGVVALDLLVTGADDVAPGVLELRLSGDLAGFEPRPGQDVMVSVPPGDAAPRWRRYTVRRWDAEAGTVDLWVTTTTDGPGAAWALGATAGDRVDAVGPRGKIAVRDDTTAHVFVVDESGLAAACAMAESLVAPASVHTFSLLAPHPQWQPSEAIGPRCARGVTLVPNVLDPDNLEWAVKAVSVFTTGVDHAQAAAYVFSELSLMRTMVGALVDAGFDEARLASKPYWRDGRANEANGEPDRGD